MDLLREKRRMLPLGGYLDSGGRKQEASQQTTVSDLPDWARPYAQQTMEKGKALTEQPYQTYNAPRIAGFSPLQQKAQQAAGQMGTSGQLGTATGLATAAGLGALGTGYAPGQFYSGTFGGRQAAQYMSPFIEQAMAPQLREAQRTADIARTVQAGQAVKSGAFGGSRAGLLEAEAGRNLQTQLGDIRAKGYQTAYEQAANQFNQDMARRMQAQQLGEQSRQFGAGLGLQGIQTGLQAAGQLGALGQAEFGQQKDILGLQSQFGAQQQALEQQGLSQAYQDFLNQQNAPYRQLGFMADLVRGMPLGQQSTSQVYQPAPSMMGQLAGLGTGIYGLSQMGLKLAEGGAVEEDGYAEGGVTNDNFIKDALTKLSDVQLAQAKQAALNARDMDKVAMIESELAERASVRTGLGNAFNALPSEQQDAVTDMAGGGIVAFADGGDTETGSSSGEQIRKAFGFLANLPIEGFKTLVSAPGYGFNKERPVEAAPAAAPKAEPTKAEAPKAAPAKVEAPKAKADKVDPEILPALQALSQKTGTPMESLLRSQKQWEEYFSSQRKDDMKSLTDLVAAQMGEGKKLKEEALPAALAAFGFKWAQAASKPGSKFLGSAAEASPVLSEVSADYRKAIRDADKADLQLQITLRQFEIAQRNGDRQLAAQLGNQAEVLQTQRDHLALQAQQIRQQGAIAQAQLRQRGEQFTQLMGVREKTAAAQGLSAAAQIMKAQQIAKKDWESGPGPRLERQLSQKYGKNWAEQPGAQAEYQMRKNEFIGAQSTTKATPVTSLLDNDDMKMLGLTE